MWIFIVAIIAIVIIVKTKSKSEEVVEHVAAHGGMREKYNVLVERILSSHHGDKDIHGHWHEQSRRFQSLLFSAGQQERSDDSV